MRIRTAILAGLVMVPMLAVAPKAAAAAPSNDEPAGATVVTGGSHIIEDFTEATASPADPYLCGMTLYNTVWFSYTPSETVDLAITITWDGVYEGAVGIYPDNPSGWACGHTTVSTAGHTYWIMAGVWSPATNPVTLTLDVAATVRPPAPAITMNVTKVTADRSGVSHVTALVTCNQEMDMALWVTSLRQDIGRFFSISGTGQGQQRCMSGTQMTITVDVVPTSGKFGGGQATLTYGGSAWNGYDGMWVPDVTITVKIRG